MRCESTQFAVDANGHEALSPDGMAAVQTRSDDVR